jgi:hypothetical protein
MAKDGTVDTLSARSLYPKKRGVTLAQAGSAQTTSNTADMSETVSAENTMIPLRSALNISVVGNPLHYWLAITFLLFGGMWLATRFAGSAAAANIKFSVYNIGAIVVLGIVGGSIAKVLFTRFPVPGVTPIVLAS